MATYDKTLDKVEMGTHPYNDMRFEIPVRNKLSTKMAGKLDKEYAKLKGKQKIQYLRSVYYRAA